MSSGSLVVLKGIRHNMYYLMGSAIIELASLEQLDGDLPDYGMKGSDKLV